MALTFFDELYVLLKANLQLQELVNSRVYKFRQAHEMEADLKGAPYKSLISCEIADLAGPKTATDPIFIINIYSRYGSDQGAAYCAEIANAIKAIIANGWANVAVETVAGRVSWNQDITGHQFRMEVRGHIKTSYSISLATSASSPEDYGDDIIFVATVSPTEAVQYRFLLLGPGTGYSWRDMTSWQARNSFAWRPTAKDVGTSLIKAQVRAGPQSSGQVDQESEEVSFQVTAPSGSGGGSNEVPTITSLTPNLASPQAAGTQIDCICIASDPDADNLYYRFFLTGPGTASKKKLVQDWTHRNSWAWKPEESDVGASTIEVQIRDGLHAAEGSYDDTESISYTVTTAGGAGSGTAPTITSLTPNLASPQAAGTQIDCICIAADADSDKVLYRFFLTGPGTASKKKLVQDWSAKNAWAWIPEKADIGTSTIEVQIRDANHAGEGSYDANTTISYVISSNSAPTITSVYANEADPFVGDTIFIVCDAADANSDQLLYRWELYRESIGAANELIADWNTQNWIKIALGKTDFDSITVHCRVRDAKHAEESGYDAESSVAIDVSRASITSVTPSLSSPRANETTVVFTCVANKTSRIKYRFWQKGPGTGNVWRDQTGWSDKNSWSWRTLACDVGTNYVRCQVADGEEYWNDTDTTSRQTDLTYVIS